jgi:large subunit ribosomal protein L13
MGKHKPIYTPFFDTGDFVVIINADKIKLTGKKWQRKKYKRYSGYPGGQKEIMFKDLFQKRPEEAIRHAVKLMLPKNRLGRRMIRKLKIYKGEKHPHQAQRPEKIDLKYIREGRL